MRYLGIDPSINNTGICVLAEDRTLLTTRQLKSKGETLPLKLHDLKWQFFDIAGPWIGGEAKVAIEQPEPHSSVRGLQAHERGDLIKLTTAFGALLAWCIESFGPMNIFLWTPSYWKGQTPKAITRKRMLRKYGEYVNSFTSDQIDALALADKLYEIKNEPVS